MALTLAEIEKIIRDAKSGSTDTATGNTVVEKVEVEKLKTKSPSGS